MTDATPTRTDTHEHDHIVTESSDMLYCEVHPDH